MNVLVRRRVKQLVPDNALMAKESWETLDKEIDTLIKEALIFAQRKTSERQQKTIQPTDIKQGLVDYCESYSLNYLLMFKDVMQRAVNEYFDKKIMEVKENASRRLLSNEINGN